MSANGTAVLPPFHLPKGPVLSWASLERGEAAALDAVDDGPGCAYTTSGRGALYQALVQLDLSPGSAVLVPTYHCPTMIAPVLHAKAVPVFYGTDRDGAPLLDAIEWPASNRPRAMIVAHYFGLPRSLAAVRAWCDRHGIVLIEDCAHALFGRAGERPVGAWGDYATGSLSKFLPVPEAGVLVANGRALRPLSLVRRRTIDQFKGIVDVLESGVTYRRLAGLDLCLRPLLALKNARAPQGHGGANASSDDGPADLESMMRVADLARIDDAPLWVSMLLTRGLPRGPVIRRRAANYACLERAFSGVRGARALWEPPSGAFAPYVFPLWVDDAERVYRELRRLKAPVFRWDRIWPGTPQALPGDQGPLWSRHVLQVLCHQELSPDDLERVAGVLSGLLTNEMSE